MPTSAYATGSQAPAASLEATTVEVARAGRLRLRAYRPHLVA